MSPKKVVANERVPASYRGRGTIPEKFVANEKILAWHRERGAIPVVLRECVIEVRQGGVVSTAIPDLKGLESAMAVARVTIPEKLSGKEIKFIRRILGRKGIEVAQRLDITPEHLSRIEGGSAALTTNTERIFRWDVVRDLRRKAPGICVKDEQILNMSFSAVRRSVTPVTLKFARGPTDDSSQHVWIFEGEENPERSLRAIA